ncbi:MAG: hypothetical protein AAF035_10160 [Pseudomonadota bacterium]
MIEKMFKKYALFCISILIGGCGIFFIYVMVANYYEEISFSEDAKVGVGTVLDKIYYPPSSEREEIFNITYQFTIQSISPQSGLSAVDRSMYNGVNIGDEIKVEYLASNPKIHRLLGTSRFYDGASPWTWVPFSLFLLLIGLALLRPGLRQVSRQSLLSRLKNEGIAITARPIEFICDKPEETEEKFRTYHIVYEYEGPDGEKITGKSQTHSRDWFEHQGVGIGDSIDILADPKNPSVSTWRKDMR